MMNKIVEEWLERSIRNTFKKPILCFDEKIAILLFRITSFNTKIACTSRSRRSILAILAAKYKLSDVIEHLGVDLLERGGVSEHAIRQSTNDTSNDNADQRLGVTFGDLSGRSAATILRSSPVDAVRAKISAHFPCLDGLSS